MWTLVGFLVGFETLSKISEILLSTTFEKWLPIEQQNRWEEESLSKYKNIVGKFIDEAVENYKKYYPEEKTIYEYDITDKDKINELKKHLIEKHFYF